MSRCMAGQTSMTILQQQLGLDKAAHSLRVGWFMVDQLINFTLMVTDGHAGSASQTSCQNNITSFQRWSVQQAQVVAQPVRPAKTSEIWYKTS